MNQATTPIIVGGQDVSHLPTLVGEGHASHLSSCYVKVDTKRVIEILTHRGFEVNKIQQDKARSRDPRFVKHMVDFRRATPGTNTPIGALSHRFKSVPRFLFTNSHNGTTRASFRLGVYRFICSNGMVIGSDWARESFIHTGDIAKQLETRLDEMMESADKLLTEIETWSSKPLTLAQRVQLANVGQELRFNGNKPLRTEQLLAARRVDDEGNDMWSVFNRLQEHLAKGGLGGISPTGRDVTTKSINSITNDMNFNTKFWAQAAAMMAE